MTEARKTRHRCDVFVLDQTMSLNILAIRLRTLARHGDSQSPAQEAADVYRELAVCYLGALSA
jgi:hypothetical protein